MANPLALWGASSWFGGPSDPSTKSSGDKTASGLSDSVPGLAINNSSTLGGWWAIKAPNGDIGIVRQTDIGPAPSTGRVFDYTYSLLPLFGYTQKSFPTGGQTYGYYLGKDLTSISLTAQDALTKLGATPAQKLAFNQSIDVGSVERGNAAVVTPAGQEYTKDPKGTNSGSEAVYSPIIPDAGIPSLASNAFKAVTSVPDWLSAFFGGRTFKDILLVIGGVILALLGANQLLKQ